MLRLRYHPHCVSAIAYDTILTDHNYIFLLTTETIDGACLDSKPANLSQTCMNELSRAGSCETLSLWACHQAYSTTSYCRLSSAGRTVHSLILLFLIHSIRLLLIYVNLFSKLFWLNLINLSHTRLALVYARSQQDHPVLPLQRQCLCKQQVTHQSHPHPYDTQHRL